MDTTTLDFNTLTLMVTLLVAIAGSTVTIVTLMLRQFNHLDSKIGNLDTRSPLLARRYTVVGELPAAMAIPGGRGAGYWPVIQLVKDWNNQPESRALMLAGDLPEGTDATAAAKIAAVVYALCQRDGHRVPEWVASARSPVDVALVPEVDLDSPYGRRLRRDAPGVCHYHRVYFSVVDLRST